jgi:RecA-family ATPase
LAIKGNSLQAIRKIWGCYVLEGSLIIFPAERGVGKTFLMLELALAVANGASSFCGEAIELHGNTLYINLELSEALVSRRINNLIKRLPSRSYTFEPICLTMKGNLEKHFSDVEKVIRDKKPVLIIIDNLRAASSHIDNEKNKQMTGFIQQRLMPLINQFNCAIILVHHTKKGTQYQRLNSDMQSGAGALTDLADGDFFLARSTQNKNYRLLKRLKSRSCEEQDDAKLLYLNPETLWFELKEESVNELDHISFETRDSDKSKQAEEMKKLHAEGKTLEEIAAIFDVNKSTVSRRIKR